MNISVLSPDKEIFKGTVKSVKVPGTLGQFQVLNNHAPIVSSLQEGTVYMETGAGTHQIYNAENGTLEEVQESGKKVSFNIGGGFIEVLNNEIALLVQGVSDIR
jgi:F-type H+-transporting ATPase subunit epsilon